VRGNKKIYYFCIILLFLIPIVVNQLMSFNIAKVYGDTNSWIGFFGSYIGSIVSGLITFVGVLLTIKFTREESRREKLPEKINNIEECLDYIEDKLNEIEILTRVDMEEALCKRSFERTTKLFTIDDNYVNERK